MYTLLDRILRIYKLYPQHILALGDEELQTLEYWAGDQQVWSIVSSRELVEQGKALYPAAKLYAHKIESYRITGMMQLSYALHGQLNRLSAAKWSDFFATTSKYMSPYGLLVLDVKLPSYYEAQSKLSSAPQLTNTSITVSSWQTKKGSYIHNQMKLEALADQSDLYRKTQTTQQYDSMSLTDIKKLASQHYEKVSIIDIKGKPYTKSANHVILICQKGGPDGIPKLK